MDLFDIAAKITLETSDYEKDLAGAEGKGSGFADKLKKGLGTAAKVGGAAIGAIATGVTALGKKFTDGIKDVAAYGDQVDKNSQKMGISAKAYQEWDFILQHSGSSIDAMQRGMMTLSKQAESNNEAFQKLGISTEDLATLNKEDLFAKTIEGLQQLGEGTERDALAAEVFGGSAKELGPLLNTAAEDVAAMRQEVNDLGGVMGDDAVKSAAAFQDSIQNLQTAIGGIKKAFISDFLPAATSISDGLTKIFSGDTTEGLKDIKKGVSDLVKTLSDKAPEIIEIGWSIVDGLITSINDNLPTLIEKGADLLLNGIIPGIIENLPMLIETGISIIGQLVTSIGQSLPELIPAAVSMIIQIVESLLDNIDLLIDAAIELIMGLADGLINAIPILIEKAPEIIEKLVSAIIRNVPKILKAAVKLIEKLVEGIGDALGSLWEAGKDIVNKVGEGISSLWDKVKNWGKDVIEKVKNGIMEKIDGAKQWGKDMIQKFIDGITEKWNALKQKVSNIAQGVKDFLGFSEPKEGPLSDFHTYAPDMMNLFMKGITDNKRRLQNTVADAFDFGDSFTAPTAPRPALAAAGAGGNGFGGNIALYIDGDKLVGATSRRMDRDLGNMQQLKARWGGRN